MNLQKLTRIHQLMGLLFKAHPWHGVSFGTGEPGVYHAYIEVVPTDTVKYEVDKGTGLLRLDRPHKYSSLCPSVYGFVPQTYCHEAVGRLAGKRTGRSDIIGDGDPLDICVITDRNIPHGEGIVSAIPIGGFCTLDGNKADDKIVAVLQGDTTYGHWTDITHVPEGVIARLHHYFLTYKDFPDQARRVEVLDEYGREDAANVISAALEDYANSFGDPQERVQEILDLARE